MPTWNRGGGVPAAELEQLRADAARWRYALENGLVHLAGPSGSFDRECSCEGDVVRSDAEFDREHPRALPAETWR